MWPCVQVRDSEGDATEPIVALHVTFWACNKGYPTPQRRLLCDSIQVTRLRYTEPRTRASMSCACSALIGRGTEVDSRDKWGWTPLSRHRSSRLYSPCQSNRSRCHSGSRTMLNRRLLPLPGSLLLCLALPVSRLLLLVSTPCSLTTAPPSC